LSLPPSKIVPPAKSCHEAQFNPLPQFPPVALCE
jgi:hypothetical protein